MEMEDDAVLLEWEEVCEKQTNDTIKVRIVITVTSILGALVSLAVLVLLFSARAYKSFLQRLFMWIVLTVPLHDLCRASSIFYKFCDGRTVISVLQDTGCEVLGFVAIWTFWCIYMLIVDLAIYLLVLVWIQTRENSAIVAKFKNSKLKRTLLEVFVFLATLFGPLVILWLPYCENQYGFDGGICGLKPSNMSAVSNRDTVIISIYNFSNIELAGLASLIATVIVTVTYFTLSVRIQHAKRIVKRLLFFLLGIFAYVMAFNLFLIVMKNVRRGFSVAILSVCVAVVGKFVLIFGYIVAFHFSRMCDPIKKVTAHKKHVEVRNQRKMTTAARTTVARATNVNSEAHREKEPLLSEPTRSTYFDVPYTGAFTTITEEDS